jgi:hypothetical protein
MDLSAATKSRAASMPRRELLQLLNLISALAHRFGPRYGSCTHNYL